MKKKIRIIPRLEIKNGSLIKGINLEGLRVLGDPFEFAKTYYNQGADEIVYTDVVASLYGTSNISKFIKRTARDLFIPLTVGGGIKSLHDIEIMLNNGADKVCLNSSAIENIKLIKEASKIFGSSTIVSNIEAIQIGKKYFISKSNGRDLINTSPFDWAKKLEDFGIGEILIISVNKEGLKSGFDIYLTKKISSILKIPVIACGGAGDFDHIYDVIKQTNISGVSMSSILHYNNILPFKFKKKDTGNFHYLQNIKKYKKKNIIKKLKIFLTKKGINVRK